MKFNKFAKSSACQHNHTDHHNGQSSHARQNHAQDTHATANGNNAQHSLGGGCCNAHDDSEHGHTHGTLPSWTRVVLAIACALAAELVGYLVAARWVDWLGMGIALAGLFLAGQGLYLSGLKDLVRGKLGIMALMAVAVTGAFLIGQWAEAAMVMALFVAAEKLEDAAMDKARKAVRELMVQVPQTTQVILPNGMLQTTNIQEVQVDDLVQIAPGERVALDGVIEQGQSALNQAPVTGESTPINKSEGDVVYAGSINTTGVLRVRISHAQGNTTLDRIVQLVEQSQSAKAPVQRTIDRFAAIYTPAVMALAVVVAVALPLLAGWSWYDALYRALALLVIACPCALVIATPVAIVSTLGNAAQQGVLFKGGQALEKAYNIRMLALDKTGTLTQGNTRLETWALSAAIGEDKNETQTVLWMAQALAAQSSHPVSKAIASGIQDQFMACGEQADRASTPALESVQEVAGAGLQAEVQLTSSHVREVVRLGNLEWLQQCGLQVDAWAAQVSAWRGKGFAVTALAVGQEVIAVFAVADTVRTEAARVVRQLRSLGLQTAMLSGDNQQAAEHIAHQVGIEYARGQLLPHDKLTAIANFQKEFGPTAMVGDGINDAPALAGSDLGIAIGGAQGTDIATETADVVLMGSHLQALPQAFALARKNHSIVWQNIALAILGKVVFMALALMGLATMWMAVAADLGISLLVILNGMRMRRWR